MVAEVVGVCSCAAAAVHVPCTADRRRNSREESNSITAYNNRYNTSSVIF